MEPGGLIAHKPTAEYDFSAKMVIFTFEKWCSTFSENILFRQILNSLQNKPRKFVFDDKQCKEERDREKNIKGRVKIKQ